jgi:outer membrane protein OmpA-like peptidoglycan-associated protein
MIMKTKVLLLTLLFGVMMSVSAQEYQPQVGFSTENGSKVNFKKNKASDNVFISLGGGVSSLFGDLSSDADFGDRLNWAAGLSVGKWYNPYLAFRLKVDGGQMKYFKNVYGSGLTQYDYNYVNAHADIMWDITNFWAPYNEKKVVRLIPFVGVGYASQLSAKVKGEDGQERRRESPTINLGLQIPFRLSERVDLFIEGQYSLLNEAWNRSDMGQEEDRVVQALLGFNFKLGRTNFEVIEPMDYDLLNDLNSQINALRAQNDELSKRPKSCPECPKVEPVKVVEQREYLNNVVFFRLNSSVIDGNQEGNIFNTSEYAKKNNLPIKVVGFADKKTGTADYNQGISERRARAVAKRLTEKYGVSSEKISIEWKGDTQQPYEINNWNRVVIMDTNN